MSKQETTLSYIGHVDIKLRVKDKVISIEEHNEGTYFLKKVFAMMLCGVTIGNQHTPQYIDLKFADPNAETLEWKSLLKQTLPLTGKTYTPTIDDERVNPKATFTATLSSTNLTQTIEEMKDAGNLLRFDLVTGLDEQGIEHILATIPTSSTKLERVTPGTQAFITWTMMIVNESEVK